MSDTGACGGLTLPARKIAALRLTQVSSKRGGRVQITTAGNTISYKRQFKPAVTLTLIFDRLNGGLDYKACQVLPWCHEDDWNEYVAQASAAGATAASASTAGATAASASASPSLSVMLTPPPTPTANKVIAQVQVSPIQHRSRVHPEDRASIGMDVLRQLCAHINCSDGGVGGGGAVMEIEEECIVDEG